MVNPQDIELIMGNFNLGISNTDDQEIDIKTVIRDFPLDVYLNEPNRTVLMQDSVAVSKSFIQMCDVNKKKQNIQRPTGFVSLKYSQTSKKSGVLAGNTNTIINKPPVGPIPLGAWCTVCFKLGPEFHKINCRDPSTESLRVTLYGLVSCFLKSKKKKYSENIEKFKNIYIKEIQFLMDSQGISDIKDIRREIYIDTFNKVLEENPEFRSLEERGIENIGNWPLLRVKYDDLAIGLGPKTKKKKSKFSNCIILSYNFSESTNSVSVRLYKSGTILLVSCPWIYKEFYNNVIEKLDSIRSIIDKDSGDAVEYEINGKSTQVKSVFSIFYYGSKFNLDQLSNYINTKTEILNKKYTESQKELQHTYLRIDNIYYRYTINYKIQQNTPKIIMKMLPCVTHTVEGDTLPKYCKPYKITVMIFKSGSIEQFFSFCDPTDTTICDESDYSITTRSLVAQFEEIENELVSLKNFLVKFLNEASDDIIYISPEEDKKDIIDNTMTGLIPYKKPNSYKVNNWVDIFNRTDMEFDKTGIVKSVETMDGDKVYKVELVDENNKPTNEFIEELTTQDIRPSNEGSKKPSVMDLARSTISGTGIKNRPNPYSFFSSCEGGKQYHVPFGGQQGRDNLFYPTCEKIKGPGKKLYISQILEGFPQNPEEEEKFQIEREGGYDYYSGLLKQGSNRLNSKIRIKLPPNSTEMEKDFFEENSNDEGYILGTIINKERSGTKGIDNYIIYSVDIGMDSPIKVTSKEFHPDYREDRRWSGISGNSDEKKRKLLDCAQKLGLSQSPFTSKRLDRNLQKSVIEALNYLNVPLRNTSVLTPQTIKKFSRFAYMGLSFPSNAQRVLFFINNTNVSPGYYFIDDTTRIRKIPIDPSTIIYSAVLDGYILDNTYYPIDCLYYKDKKLTVPYVKNYQKTEEIYESFEDEMDESREEFEDLDKLDLGISVQIEESIKNMEFGRLFYVVYMSHLLNKISLTMSASLRIKFMNPLDYCSPSINTESIWNSLNSNNIITDTKKILNNNEDLTFIPQKGNSTFLRWKRLLKTPVVLQLIKKKSVKPPGSKKSVDRWIVGIGNKTVYPLNETPIALPKPLEKTLLKKHKDDRFLQFNLNFMADGKLNPEEPLLLTIKPMATKQDAHSWNRTELIIKAMLEPINERVFTSINTADPYWELINGAKIILKPNDYNPGTSPLLLS